MNCGHCNGISTALRNSFSLPQPHHSKDDEHAANSLSVFAALEMVFDRSTTILEEGTEHQNALNKTTTELKFCAECVQALSELIKASQDFIKLREDLSETAKLFPKIVTGNRKPRKAVTSNNKSASVDTKFDTPTPIDDDIEFVVDFEVPETFADAVSDNENDSTKIRSQTKTRTTRTTNQIDIRNMIMKATASVVPGTKTAFLSSDTKLREDKNNSTKQGVTTRRGNNRNRNASSCKTTREPKLKELVIRLERCDKLLGPDGKVNFIEIKEELEDEYEIKAEMNDGDFFMVPTPDEQEGNSDPLWIPENEDEPMEVEIIEIIENKEQISSAVSEKTDAAPPGTVASLPSNFQYPCLHCPQKLPTVSTFQQHVTNIHPETIKPRKPFGRPESIEPTNQCALCNVKYTSYKLLARHTRKLHCDLKRYKCPRSDCDRSLYSPYGLTIHLKHHDGIRRYKGRSKSRAKGASMNSMKPQFKFIRDSKLACPSCPESLPNPTKFLDHVTQTHPELIIPGDCTQRNYNPNLPLECTICKFHYPDDRALTRHIKRRHVKPVKPFVCPHEGCNQIFRFESKFKSHVKVHNQEKPRIVLRKFRKLECPACPEKFHNPQEFMGHVVQTHPEFIKPRDAESRPAHTKAGSLKCLICNLNYQDKSIRQHLRAVHTNFNKYVCSSDGCGAAFGTKLELDKHKDAHAQGINPPLFTCPVENCGRILTDKTKLSRHIGKKHPAPKPLISLTCPYCSKDFSNENETEISEIMKHIVENHRELVKPPKEPWRKGKGKEEFKCLICEVNYKSSGSLWEHLRFVHLKIRPFKCPHLGCHRSFCFNHKLETHVKNIHERSTKFICDLCGQEFVSLGSLNMHRKYSRKHNTEFLSNCPECHKEFTQKSSMQKHLKDFHGNGSGSTTNTKNTKPLPVPRRFDPDDERIKPHPTTCSLCSESFPCLFDFDAHFRAKHPDEDPPAIYSCSHSGCEKKFKLWDQLKYHLRSHNLNLICHFPECTMAFYKRQNYNKHLETHHLKSRNREKKFACNKCPQKFLTSDGHRNHIWFVHEGKARPGPRFPCTYPGCEKILSTNYVLKIHLQTHEENREPTHPCTYPGCDKKFFTPNGVYQHNVHIHEKRKPWPRSRKKSKVSHTSANDANPESETNETEIELTQHVQMDQESGDARSTVDFSALIALE